MLVPVSAFPNGLMTFVAQNFGANQKERMLKGTRACNSILSTWSIFCVIIAYFFARPLIHLLAGTNNPVILKNINFATHNINTYIP